MKKTKLPDRVPIFDELINNMKKNIGSELTSSRMNEIRIKYNVEDFLNYFALHYPVLLHGSAYNFNGAVTSNNHRHIICATDYAPVALLKAVVLNEKHNLDYPGRKQENFSLKIEGNGEPEIMNKGYVYIISNSNFTPGNYEWEYLKQGEAPILGKIEVLKSDFKHPVYHKTSLFRMKKLDFTQE